MIPEFVKSFHSKTAGMLNLGQGWNWFSVIIMGLKLVLFEFRLTPKETLAKRAGLLRIRR